MMLAQLDGFLGTRASLMLDVVLLLMVIVLPLLGISLAAVRYRRRFSLHKAIQLTLGVVLLIVVAAFEIEMRRYGWQVRARGSQYLGGAGGTPWVSYALGVHLVFAVSTVLLWTFVIVQALRLFPRPPLPGEHSRSHVFWARLAAIDMVLTALTGSIFYWLAFVG